MTDRMSTAMDEAARSVVDVRDEAASQVSHVGQEVKSHTGDVVHQARIKVGEQADQGTRQLADTLASAGRELSSMAASSQQPDGPMTGLVRQIGDRATSMGQEFQVGGYRALAGDLSRFARSSPGLFLLSAAAAGFAVGRLIRNADRQALSDAARQAPEDRPAPDRSSRRLESSDVEPDLQFAAGGPSGVDVGQAGAVISAPTAGEEAW